MRLIPLGFVLILSACSLLNTNGTDNKVGTDSGGAISSFREWLQKGILLKFSIPLETFDGKTKKK